MSTKRLILESTRLPRLIVLTGLLLITIAAACCSGCAAVEQFTDDHPAIAVGTELAIGAGAAIVAASELSKHNRVVVVKNDRRTLGPL